MYMFYFADDIQVPIREFSSVVPDICYESEDLTSQAYSDKRLREADAYALCLDRLTMRKDATN